MTLETARNFFLWCFIINYGILLLWFVMFVAARGWMHRFHGRWFRLTDSQFDAIHYGSMAVFKVGIFLLNLVPFIVLWILG